MAHYRRYLALYSYDDDEEQSLSFSKGDVLEVVPDEDSEWWEGRLLMRADGSSVHLAKASGFVPSNYIREIVDDEALDEVSSVSQGIQNDNAQQDANLLERNDSLYVRARALYDWDGDSTQPHVLTFKEGAIMHCIPDENAQWWDAKTQDGVVGVVPYNYVELIDTPDSTLTNVDNEQNTGWQPAVALYDFVSDDNSSEYMDLHCGQAIWVSGNNLTEDWVEAYDSEYGISGYVPSSFVRLQGENEENTEAGKEEREEREKIQGGQEQGIERQENSTKKEMNVEAESFETEDEIELSKSNGVEAQCVQQLNHEDSSDSQDHLNHRRNSHRMARVRSGISRKGSTGRLLIDNLVSISSDEPRAPKNTSPSSTSSSGSISNDLQTKRRERLRRKTAALNQQITRKLRANLSKKMIDHSTTKADVNSPTSSESPSTQSPPEIGIHSRSSSLDDPDSPSKLSNDSSFSPSALNSTSIVADSTRGKLGKMAVDTPSSSYEITVGTKVRVLPPATWTKRTRKLLRNKNDLLLLAVVSQVNIDGTYDVVVSAQSVEDDVSINDRHIRSVKRKDISLSAWNTISGNVAPMRLSTLQSPEGFAKFDAGVTGVGGTRIEIGNVNYVSSRRLNPGGKPIDLKKGHSHRQDRERNRMRRRVGALQKLSDIPFFKFLSRTEAVNEDVTETHLAEIFKRFRFHIYAPGSTICYEGAIGKEFFIVLNGSVAVLRDGRQIATLKPGSWFGELAVFKWTRRTATCVAQGSNLSTSDDTTQKAAPTELLSLSSRSFTELSSEQPWLQLAMADLCHQRTGEMLRCISFFKQVQASKLELLGSLFTYRSAAKGKVICREGDESTEFYILIQGQVRMTALSDIEKENALGPQEEHELAVVDSISWFGEIGLIQKCRRTATVTATEDSTLLVLSAKNFNQFLRVIPDLSKSMREAMGERISKMIQSIPFFANVKKLDLLSSLFHLREYDAGVTIFNQGEPSDAFYMILKGQCHVYAKKETTSSDISIRTHPTTASANSRVKEEDSLYSKTSKVKSNMNEYADMELLRVLDAHDFFGEIGLLNDVPRTSTIVCKKHARILRLPKHLFSKFVSFAPSIKNALKAQLELTGQRESSFRPNLSRALLASANKSWIDADIDHLAGIDGENCPVPFDSREIRQTPLMWGSGRAQLQANGDRQDGLPEDIINPMLRGKAERHQYIQPRDLEEPKGFTLPAEFYARIVFPPDQPLQMFDSRGTKKSISKEKKSSDPDVSSCLIKCYPNDTVRRIIARALDKMTNDDYLRRILLTLPSGSKRISEEQETDNISRSTDAPSGPGPKELSKETLTSTELRMPDKWRVKVLGRCDYMMDLDRRLVASMYVQQHLRKNLPISLKIIRASDAFEAVGQGPAAATGIIQSPNFLNTADPELLAIMRNDLDYISKFTEQKSGTKLKEEVMAIVLTGLEDADESKGHLRVQKGEKITVRPLHEQVWFPAVTSTGRTGLVPASHIQEIIDYIPEDSARHINDNNFHQDEKSKVKVDIWKPRVPRELSTYQGETQYSSYSSRSNHSSSLVAGSRASIATRGYTEAGIRNDRLAALLDVADDALMDEGFCVSEPSSSRQNNHNKHFATYELENHPLPSTTSVNELPKQNKSLLEGTDPVQNRSKRASVSARSQLTLRSSSLANLDSQKGLARTSKSKMPQHFISAKESPWPYRISVLGVSNIAALYPEKRRHRYAGDDNSGSEDDDDDEADDMPIAAQANTSHSNAISPTKSSIIGAGDTDENGRLRAYNEGRRRENQSKVQAIKSAMEKYPFLWLQVDIVLNGKILATHSTNINKRGLSQTLKFDSRWMYLQKYQSSSRQKEKDTPSRNDTPVSGTSFASHPAANKEHGKLITIKDLPLSARVRFTVFACKDLDPPKSKRKKRRAKGLHDLKPVAVGGVSMSVYDHQRVLRSGMRQLRLWSGRSGEMCTACVENRSKRSHLSPLGVATLHLNLDDYPRRVWHPLPPQIPRGVFKLPPPNKRPSAKLPKAVIADHRQTCHRLLGIVKFGRLKESGYRQNSQANISEAGCSDPLTLPNRIERSIIWQQRYDLVNIQEALPLVLLCVDWQDETQRSEAYCLLSVWKPLTPLQALELLGHRFGDYRVRQYAVRRMEEFSDSELGRFLLQLVQALKVEPFHRSPLAFFLIRRALASPELVGQVLFWQLRSEMHNPFVAERFGVLLRSYLMQATHHRNGLSRQNDVQNFLKTVADDVVSESRKGVSGQQLRKFAQKRLRETNGYFPGDSQLCLDPRFRVTKLEISQCKVMNSKKKPLWLAFRNADPAGERVMVMFKSGDDLRQDQMTLQIISFMDELWLREGLDLKLTPYRCVSTGNELGMLEIVLGSNTIANIQKEQSGYTGAFKSSTLRNWLQANMDGSSDVSGKSVGNVSNGHDPPGWDTVVDNFVCSCAGYCVLSYVLGIGDRHADNIMLKKDGHLFHIDFGHYLGNFKKKLGFKRERTPFVFTREMAYVMHGRTRRDKSPAYKKFVDVCAKAFNILRKNARVLIVLFQLMIPAGIPELTCDADIAYLRDKLALDLDDVSAAKRIQKEIKKCLNDYYRLFDNFVVSFAPFTTYLCMSYIFVHVPIHALLFALSMLLLTNLHRVSYSFTLAQY